jgi:hypothetical protein
MGQACDFSNNPYDSFVYFALVEGGRRTLSCGPLELANSRG